MSNMLLNTPTEEGNKKFREALKKFYSIEKFNISILNKDVEIILRSLAFFVEDNSTSDSERQYAMDLAERIEQQIISSVQLLSGRQINDHSSKSRTDHDI